jgi:hypothetical protein
MQATWSQPVAEGGGVLERLRQPAGASEASVGDLDAPGVPDGADHAHDVQGPADPAVPGAGASAVRVGDALRGLMGQRRRVTLMPLRGALL